MSYVSVSLTHTDGKFHWYFNIKALTHFIIGVPFQLKTLGVKKKPCGAFEVTWNPPTLDSGGGPLTGYQVQLKLTENGGWRNCTAFSSNHSCLFKDLRNKTRYQIRVRAFNKKGPGQWADIFETTDLIGKYSILILLYYTKVMATLWYSIIITFYSSHLDLFLLVLLHAVRHSFLIVTPFFFTILAFMFTPLFSLPINWFVFTEKHCFILRKSLIYQVIVGPPDVSKIINNETEIPGKTPNVTVQWTRPNERNCSITMYSLRYKAVLPAAEKMTEINITNASVTSFQLQFQHSKKYEVTVLAWNNLRPSEASKAWEIRTKQCKQTFFG